MKRTLTGMVLVFAGLLCGSCAHRAVAVSTAPAPTPDEDESDVHAPWDRPVDRDARQAWFQAHRLSAARLHEVQTLLGTAAPAASSTTVNPQQWTSIGPQPINTSTNPDAGSVLNLALDPHNPDTIYAGTYVGKLGRPPIRAPHGCRCRIPDL
jgi:hypothetical protein